MCTDEVGTFLHIVNFKLSFKFLNLEFYKWFYNTTKYFSKIWIILLKKIIILKISALDFHANTPNPKSLCLHFFLIYRTSIFLYWKFYLGFAGDLIHSAIMIFLQDQGIFFPKHLPIYLLIFNLPLGMKICSYFFATAHFYTIQDLVVFLALSSSSAFMIQHFWNCSLSCLVFSNL